MLSSWRYQNIEIVTQPTHELSKGEDLDRGQSQVEAKFTLKEVFTIKIGPPRGPNLPRILPLILESVCGRAASSSCFSARPSLHIYFYSQNSNQAFFPAFAFNDHRLIYKVIENNNSVEPSVLMKEKSGAFAIMGNAPEPSPGYGY